VDGITETFANDFGAITVGRKAPEEVPYPAGPDKTADY
jgi:hypothetical protein